MIPSAWYWSNNLIVHGKVVGTEYAAVPILQIETVINTIIITMAARIYEFIISDVKVQAICSSFSLYQKSRFDIL